MLRAAAKNHAAVTVVVDAGDYGRVLKKCGTTVECQRRHPLRNWRSRAFGAYRPLRRRDRQLSRFDPRRGRARDPFPRSYTTQFVKAQDMRYGENPHQQAAFYVDPTAEACIATARQLQGKELLQQRCRHRCRAGMRQEFRRASLRDRQARQSLWRGGRLDHSRRLPPRLPGRSDQPSAASSPSTRPGWTASPPRRSPTASSSK